MGLRSTYSVVQLAGLRARVGESVRASNQVTFVDTPGHTAFASMRTRGMTMTDMVSHLRAGPGRAGPCRPRLGPGASH